MKGKFGFMRNGMLMVGLALPSVSWAQTQVGASEGLIFGRRYAAVSYDVNTVLLSRSGESWYPALAGAALLFEPPRLRPEGIAFRNGLLYVTGDWQETQNQIAVFHTNAWGDIAFDHPIREPLSNPPPMATPNNQWWGPEGITFNTGLTGVGAGAGTLVSVDNLQNGIGNTFATVDLITGALSGFRVVTYPEDIAYGPLSQRFYLVQRSPNIVQVFDANMNALALSWPLPTHTRGIAVVSPAFGQAFTGDNTLTGDVIIVVSEENTAVTPIVHNRLSAYRADGTLIGAEQDISWIDLSLDNSSGGGAPGPHTYHGVAVDEANNVMYICDNAARAVYVIKPVTNQTSVVSGPVFGRTWTARGQDVHFVLPTRNTEPWFAPAQAQGAAMNDPPSLNPTGLAFRNGLLYASADWQVTQNQLAVFTASASGSLTFNRAIQIPVTNPPPNPGAVNNAFWGPEGITFNTSASGYGPGGNTLISGEGAQFQLNGNTRALVNIATGALSSFGQFTSTAGAAQPDDIAYGPLSNRFYVIAHSDVMQVWANANPPTYANTQFATITRTRGVTVISPTFAQFLLQNASITQECLLVVAMALPGSASGPTNRLAVYSLTGALLGQQDLQWTRDAFPGQPLQSFQAIAVDEANKVIYIGDEKANGVFVLTFSDCTTGDTSGNGSIDADDIQPFLAALMGAGTPTARCAADMNHDSAVTGADVPLFVAALLQ